MSTAAREYCRLQRKLAAIRYATAWENVARACHTFGVSRAGFYRWKKIHDAEGEVGLKQRKPIAKDHLRRIPQSTVEKVLELRRKYHLGATTNRLVHGAIPWDMHLLLERVPNPRPKWTSATTQQSRPSCAAHPSLLQTIARPSHTDGRQVPQLGNASWLTNTPLPVHGD